MAAYLPPQGDGGEGVYTRAAFLACETKRGRLDVITASHKTW